MTNKLLLLILLAAANNMVKAQSSKSSLLYRHVSEKRLLIKNTSTVNLFHETNTSTLADLKATLSAHSTLILNKKLSRELFKQRPQSISLSLITSKASYQLELVQEDISGNKFPVGKLTATGSIPVTDTIDIIHYRGYIAGDANSIASMSVFGNGELMCLFSNADGNYNLGKTGDSTYVLYNSSKMLSRLNFECGTDHLPVISNSTSRQSQPAINIPLDIPATLCKKVRVYWEASYKLYSNNFSSNFTNTANYLSGLFNQVAVMYQNEGIIIDLAQINVWISADPYTTDNANNGLATLKSRWNNLGDNFNGDICLLIDGAPTNNGGVAYLLDNDLCNRAYAYGYTDVYAAYNTVPVYSWDVEELTHEMGHLMGSHHTHWCGWNTGSGGACGAIDDCSPAEASVSCTTCAATTSTNPAPPGFTGTVMSYCYLRSGIGVNLSYGFGPLPQAAIRNAISNAVCASFDNQWTGAAGNAWENAANWSCGTLPNDKTDVTIPGGLTNYPLIKSNAVCRRLIQKSNSTVTVNPGFTLKISGNK